ncbi:m143R [Myxoma virus]|uniref:Host range factor p28 n=2 Tax=Myxoma virus TaxID=10273 RepID=Q9Q8G0_MYXVL|nr:N1R/p28-like protein [Myxoma virus]ACB28938.1 m143R [recombinant virus 6918VP60-T2]AAF15031.1 m143R [Myxoma virus]ACB28766.1 m143R [Myxoma virus]AFU77075.1 m143R [Myxoma virus]AFU77242.1 m143R [Myxoma virus]
MDHNVKILDNDYGINIVFLRSNHYINITRLCAPMKKSFTNWKALKNSKYIMNSISIEENIDIDDLTFRIYKNKYSVYYHGIFVHPKLLKYVLSWISDEYYAKVYSIINAYDENILKNTVLTLYVNYIYCLKQEDMLYKAIHHRNKTYHRLLKTIPNVVNEYETLYDSYKGEECAICMEPVYAKPIKSSFFGVLSHCNHVFCIECIDRWKKQNNKCPVCRTIFVSVTKSRFFYKG